MKIQRKKNLTENFSNYDMPHVKALNLKMYNHTIGFLEKEKLYLNVGTPTNLAVGFTVVLVVTGAEMARTSCLGVSFALGAGWRLDLCTDVLVNA